MVLAEVVRAAERLYREYALEAVDETVEIALRDGGVRRDLERAVARALTLAGAPPADVAESLLAGGVAGSGGGRRHALALASLRSGPSRRPPPATEEFVARAAVPSLWGDTYAAATLEDGRGALFRVLAQVQLAPAAAEVGEGPPEVTVDRRFSGDADDAPSLQAVAATAVAAAFDVLRARAAFPPVAPLERAWAVRLWRGGLPWP
ncbi:MAG TPA: hypothetical protein VM263_03705, partial [Acidimicrobiales bacterium]|nr:hypothetical protein [Acidimicrobiales bacterium]